MKKIFTFKTIAFNGTVTMSNVACFTDKDVAIKSRDAVIKANEGNFFPSCLCTEIEETNVYENETEVPILNKKNNE